MPTPHPAPRDSVAGLFLPQLGRAGLRAFAAVGQPSPTPAHLLAPPWRGFFLGTQGDPLRWLGGPSAPMRCGSVLVRKYDREGQSAHQNEADGPSRIQIEPAPRYELETQVAVD